MYICVCRCVTTEDIGEAVQKGAETASDITMLTGAGTCCGMCLPFLNGVVSEQVACRKPAADRAAGQSDAGKPQ